MATAQTSQPDAQDTSSFRRLVEQKITIDEYVRDLERRSTELREGATSEEHEEQPG